MKTIMQLTAWVLIAFVALYAAIHPEYGVLYHNTFATLGVGLIGLGLCICARSGRADAA